MPDAKLHFNWYLSDSDASGTWRTFGPSFFDPVVVGNPMTGVARFSGTSGGTTYLQVAQTARVNAGASSYTLTYAITNSSGVAQTDPPGRQRHQLRLGPAALDDRAPPRAR